MIKKLQLLRGTQTVLKGESVKVVVDVNVSGFRFD